MTINYNKTDNTVSLTKQNVYSILKNNPDKYSKDIDNTLLDIVEKRWLKFTTKQLSWLKSKLSFIFRHSPFLKDYKKVKDFIFMDNTEYGFKFGKNNIPEIVYVPLTDDDYIRLQNEREC